MAAFTSVTNGNWNDGATWGKTSPGDKGTDWPGVAADTATVDAGDTVAYNVSEANELGAITVNGKLAFVINANTKLAIGNASLTVGAAGELEIGTTANPIPKEFTVDVSFNTTSDNANGISITNGGLCHICGDPNYCTNYESTLANDAENTDNDAVIITNDDRSADWHVGDDITIQREYVGDSSSYTDAIIKRTIQSMSGTSITLTETVTGMVAGVGDTWTSTVVNVTRNVRIYKKDAVTDIQSSSRYNTNRPRFVDSNTANPNTDYISNAQITGFYRVTTSNEALTDVVIRNGERALDVSNNNTISGNIYACNYGLNNSNNNTISGNIYACNYGLSTSNNNTISGNIYLCNSGVYSSNNNTLSGNIYSCSYGLNASNDNTISGKLGYNNSDTSLPNTSDFRSTCTNNLLFNCKLPAAGLAFTNRNTIGTQQTIQCEHHDRVLNAMRIYHNKGDIIKTPCGGSGTSPSEDPDGGALDCIEISNLQTNLSVRECIEAFLPQRYQIFAAASTSKTYTFKFQSTFTATLANTEVILSASYLSSTDGTRTVVNSTGTLAARSGAADWDKTLSVVVNPAQAGFVDIQIKLCKYESGKKLYIWPEVAIT